MSYIETVPWYRLIKRFRIWWAWRVAIRQSAKYLKNRMEEKSFGRSILKDKYRKTCEHPADNDVDTDTSCGAIISKEGRIDEQYCCAPIEEIINCVLCEQPLGSMGMCDECDEGER